MNTPGGGGFRMKKGNLQSIPKVLSGTTPSSISLLPNSKF